VGLTVTYGQRTWSRHLTPQVAHSQRGKSWSRKSAQGDKWSFWSDAAAYAAPVIPEGPARLLSPTFKSSSGEYRD